MQKGEREKSPSVKKRTFHRKRQQRPRFIHRHFGAQEARVWPHCNHLTIGLWGSGRTTSFRVPRPRFPWHFRFVDVVVDLEFSISSSSFFYFSSGFLPPWKGEKKSTDLRPRTHIKEEENGTPKSAEN